MKVYVFYLKSDKSIYAFTTLKEQATLFHEQRNSSLFKEKVIKMNKEEFQSFNERYSNCRLIDDILEDSKGETIYIVDTIKENLELTESCDYISTLVSSMKNDIKKLSLKDKYVNDIMVILKSMISPDNILNIDTVSLFMSLNKKTFLNHKNYDE